MAASRSAWLRVRAQAETWPSLPFSLGSPPSSSPKSPKSDSPFLSPSATPAPSRTSTSARQPPTLIVLRLFSILHQSVSRCSPFALRLCVCVAAASVHEALHRQILARTHLLVGPVRFDRLLRTWLSSHPNNAVRFAYIVSVFLLRFSMSLVI